jgi:hypothetical protein
MIKKRISCLLMAAALTLPAAAAPSSFHRFRTLSLSETVRLR